jgi:hypothetical protein
MGFTLTRNLNSLSVSSLPSVEQEAIAAMNHSYMEKIALNPPIAIGSLKQITWAKAIAAQFLFYAHAWGFKASQIDLIFANRGKYAKFWIDNRCERSGEGTTRIAVEKELAELERDRQASLKSESKSETELRSLARRF